MRARSNGGVSVYAALDLHQRTGITGGGAKAHCPMSNVSFKEDHSRVGVPMHFLRILRSHFREVLACEFHLTLN